MKIKDWKKFNDSLILNKTPFRVVKTSMTILFETPYGSFKFIDIKNGTLPISELYFIKTVGDYCKKLNLHFDEKREDVNYIKTINFTYDFCENEIVEIDLSSAYWNFAHRAGIISDEIFEKGKTISKKTRLAALGALAKTKTNLDFDGEKFNVISLEESEKASYFFHVAKITGEIMEAMRAIAGSDFLVYWVDAIFVKKRSAKMLEQFLQDNELKYQRFEIDEIKREGEYLLVTSEDWKQKKQEKKNTRKLFLKKDDKDFLHKHEKNHRQQWKELKTETKAGQ